MYGIELYVTREGRNPFATWYERLRDHRVKLAVDRRLARVRTGDFGDHKFCGDGVWELRIDVGAGHRIYYAIGDEILVLLLRGGDKSSQSADIAQAISCWRDWKERNDEKRKP